MSADLSLARVLAVALADADVGVFTPGALGRVFATAGLLPAVMSRRVYFESRLTGDVEQVDLSVHVDRARREVLAGRDRHFALAGDVTRCPQWDRVHALATAWSEPGGSLDETVAGAWLEFDLDPQARSRAVPGVFVDFDRRAYTGGSVDDRASLAAAAAVPLLGGLPARVRPTLDRAFRALPAGATIPYLGVLLSRGDGVIRLCVDGLDDAGLVRYLEAVHWPGDVAYLVDLLHALGATRASEPAAAAPGVPRRTLVHLDVGVDVGPRLGLELVLGRRAQIRGVVAEERFLRALVAHGLCTVAASDALLAWPRCRYVQLPHELWPTLVVRRVNHIKLTVQADASVAAKAYRCLGYEYVSGAMPA